MHLVPQPLDRCSGHENRPLQGVSHLTIQSPGDGGYQTMPGKYGLLAGIHQHETAGSVCIFGFPRSETGLAEQRCLLIACGSRQWNRSAQKGRIRLAIDARCV